MTRPDRPRHAPERLMNRRPTGPAARAGSPQRARSMSDWLRGLLSVLLLAALLVGVPAALIALRGNPLPDTGLHPGALARALTSPDDGSMFLAALTWLAWAGWASFAVSVLVEIPAQVRGLPSPHLPALGLQQRTASALVAGAALLISLPLTALSSPALGAGPPAATASASRAHTPGGTGVTPTSPPAPATPAVRGSGAPSQHPGSATYTVRPGDSLWQIATDQLGDGTRFTEIAQLNYGLHQPDGQALGADHWLRPGWTLRLPTDATPTTTTGSRTQPARGSVTVQPGDTLWDIAQDTLGNGARYPEIAAASTGPQPGGEQLTDPDLIRPGWHLTLPDTAGAATDAPDATAARPAPTPTTPAAAEPPTKEPPPAEHTATAPFAPSAPPAPAAQAGDTDPASRTAPATDETDVALRTSSRANGGADRRGADQHRAAASDDDGRDEMLAAARTPAGIGALLGAAVLTLLAAKRARQQRRRRPGQRIAMPTGPLAATERDLRLVQDPTGNARVDQALRTLSAALGRTGGVLPSLRWARLTAQHLELYLADPTALPPPFTPTADPTVWTLQADATLPPAEELAAVPAPYPALVAIGQDLDGAHVLLDLEHLGALAVHGTAEGTAAVLAALAAELATSPWADDLQVTVVGCLHSLAAALGPGRVRYLPDLEALLPALEQQAADMRAALAAHDLRDLQQARTASTDEHLPGDAWTPELVLIAGPLEPAGRSRLEAVLHELPRVSIAAVTTDPAAITEWQLHLDVDNPSPDSLAVLAPLGLTVRPQQLTAADLEHLLGLLAIADEPATTPQPPPGGSDLVTDEPTVAELGSHLAAAAPPEPAAPDTPGVAVTPPDHAEASARPLVQILGFVDVLHPRGRVEPSKRRQLTEIAAFLALHPGADHHGLSEAIWPGARAVENTRNTALSKLRKWLGSSDDGSDYVPRVVNDGYRLHPDVTTDWHHWQHLLPDGPAAAPTSALAAALDLIKGRPFAGTNPRRYAWADRDRQDITSAIVDVAHELARRALLDANAPLARRAAAAGLHADPGAELLWRDALKAEWLAGDRTGLESTADRLTALIDELGDDLEPETVALLEELLHHPRHRIAAG